LMQTSHECDNGVVVETLFIHESGEQISAGKLHVPAAKQDPQGYGSALTYARRYALMAACGIAPEDDDGNAATKGQDAAYKAFEDEHLHRLRGAALESVEALQKAFGAIPASPMKAKLWATHGQSLKNANKN